MKKDQLLIYLHDVFPLVIFDVHLLLPLLFIWVIPCQLLVLQEVIVAFITLDMSHSAANSIYNTVHA